jgi:hypothetical protein
VLIGVIRGKRNSFYEPCEGLTTLFPDGLAEQKKTQMPFATA